MDSSFAWRTPFIILACSSMMFAVASMLWLVPSPRWLNIRGRQSEASTAWDLLGVGHAEREKAEIELAATGVEAHNLVDSTESTRQQSIASHTRTPGATNKHSFFDVFARDVRSRTFLAAFLFGMQQLSGIDGVLYVSLIKPRRIPLCTPSHEYKSLTPSSTHLYFSLKQVLRPQKLPFLLLASRQLLYLASLSLLFSSPTNGVVDRAPSTEALDSALQCSLLVGSTRVTQSTVTPEQAVGWSSSRSTSSSRYSASPGPSGLGSTWQRVSHSERARRPLTSHTEAIG